MNSRKNIKDFIAKTLIEEFKIESKTLEELNDESDLFFELDSFNSIDGLELLVILEEHYQLEDSYDDLGIESLRTIGSLTDYISSRLG